MINKPKGTEDILPAQIDLWHYVEDTARSVLESYNFQEIRTPMFEEFELFQRGVGDETDMVSKEMYDFKDKGERHVALRPEGTAPIVRAFVQHKLYGPEYPQPLKVYYMGPMFRYERPQAGRQRQFHQLGVEVLGSINIASDVEVIAMAIDLFEELGLENLKLVINNIGKMEERRQYIDDLVTYLTPLKDQLSEDSQRRLMTNPLRILDSKDEGDRRIIQSAPRIADYLSEESRTSFNQLQSMLTSLNISYEIDPFLVRGIDYYQETIFEIMVTDDSIGTQATVCGGGRYDGLVQELGGPATPGVGFGLGLERLLILLEQQKVELPEDEGIDLFVMTLDDSVNELAMKVVQAARKDGLIVDRDYLGRSMKSQYKTVDKLKAKAVIILGENELDSETIPFKNLATQKTTNIDKDEWDQNPATQFRQLTMDTSVLDQYFKGE